ncbi:MAG: hypothetical protein ACI4CS_00835 [Candidatus Weimeria sp.]
MKYLNSFHLTGRVVGGFKTASGCVITVMTRSGKDAFVKVTTREKEVPGNGTRVEVDGYVSRRRGYDRDRKAFFAQCFVATEVSPEKTTAEKDLGSKGLFYDEPSFDCYIAGEVMSASSDGGFSKVLVRTKKPNGKDVNIWLSMRTPERGITTDKMEGKNMQFVAGVFTGNRKHETLTVRDLCLVDEGYEREEPVKDLHKEAPEEKAEAEEEEKEPEKKSRKRMSQEIVL